MAFKRSFRPRVARRKNNYSWQFGANDGFIACGAGATSIAALMTITDGTEDVTLARMRGFLSIAGNSAGYTPIWGAAGIIRCTDREFAGGGGVVPGPYTNADYDWIWHTFWSSAINATLGITALHFPIDSKAMRRIDDNDRLVLVVENQGTTSIDFTYGVRCLINWGKR